MDGIIDGCTHGNVFLLCLIGRYAGNLRACSVFTFLGSLGWCSAALGAVGFPGKMLYRNQYNNAGTSMRVPYPWCHGSRLLETESFPAVSPCSRTNQQVISRNSVGAVLRTMHGAMQRRAEIVDGPWARSGPRTLKELRMRRLETWR